MATIITRAGKGIPLTNDEMDANLNNLNTDKIEVDTVDTLTNKSIDLADNTLTGTIAEFNTACIDANFLSTDGVDILTNKTLVTPKIDAGIDFLDDPVDIQINTTTVATITGNGALSVGTSGYGSDGQVLKSGGSGASVEYDSVLNKATAVTASGTSIDFTSIPNWVNRIIVVLSGCSLSGSSQFLVQLGAGSIENTGYVSGCAIARDAAASLGGTSTAGMLIYHGSSTSNLFTGILTLIKVSGNLWVSSITGSNANASTGISGGGNKTLAGTLDRVRITTVNGTDTFDAGTIVLSWE